MKRCFSRPAPSLALSLAGRFAWAAPLPATSIDLAAWNVPRQWVFYDETAGIKDGQLVLDGRREVSRAVFAPREWSDRVLKARFKVDSAPS
jgi:hypothetical protein